ncbi:MAG: hypothetical protein ACE5FO_00520 [Parvularculaceae bacterium]
MTWFFSIVAFVLVVMTGLYWRWKKRIEAEIAEDAGLEWERLKKAEPELVEGLDEAGFHAIYARVHFPRFPGYALACTATFLLSLPVTLALLAGSYVLGEKLGLIAEPAELAKYVPISGRGVGPNAEFREEMALELATDFAGFYYFFGVLIVWLVIVALFMRRYHSRRPGYLRDEIIRAR